MTYTKIQFIAYEIDTFPVETAPIYDGKKNVSTASGTVELPCFKQDTVYKGLPNASSDVKARCSLMRDAVLAAKKSSKVNKSASCLKVFMAPEFYFRGDKGAYPIDAYMEAIAALRDTISGREWNHWLFLFGSLLVIIIDDNSSSKEVQNIVFIHEGGVNSDSGSRIVVKEFMSGIDFLKKYNLVKTVGGSDALSYNAVNQLYTSGVHHPTAGKKKGFIFKSWSENRGSGKEQQQYNYDGLGIFNMGGITFGVEVCLDHLLKRLRQSPPARNNSHVQVQLIPSAGMSIQDQSVVACTNGYVFNTDGHNRSDAKKVTSACSGKSTNARLSATLNVVDTIPLHGGAKKGVFKKCFQDGRVGAPNLKVYEAQNAPATLTRTGFSKPYK